MSLFTRPGRPIRSPLPLPLFGADCGVGFGRMLVVAAVALSSTFVVAGTSPVVADEAPVAQTAALLDPATMTAEELATAFPDEFAFLSAEYGLTPAGAADALRLTWEAGSTREWAMGSVSGYAGTWVDYRKGTVFVGVAGGSRGMKDAQRSLASAPSSAAARTALIGRQRPMSTLLSDARLLAIAADPLDTGSVYVQIDEQRNQLVVVGMSAERAQQLPAVTRLVRGAGYSPVEFRAAEVAAPTDVRGGWDGKQGAGCTMAFTVVNPANERGVLTAGHCADNQVSASGVTLSEAQFDRSFWATGAADYGYDRQLHLVPAGTKTVGSLQVPSVSISGSFLPAVGSVVCRYGASSVGKGQSTAFCSTVSGYGYDGFVGMRHGCIYGDSGGPMWVMGKAVGIAAVTTDPTWPVDSTSTCYAAPVKDQLNGTGFYLQDATFGSGTDFSNIGLFHPIAQMRVLDTRHSGAGIGEIDVPLAGALNFPDLGSVALSVTIVPQGTAGSATVYPGDDGIVPFTYDVSFGPTAPESNLVVSRVNRYTKSVKVSVSQVAFVIVDVLGYFSDTSGTVGAGGATKVVGLSPARVYDSRSATPLPSGAGRDIQVRGVGGVPSTATAVIANLTVTRTTSSGWLTAHAGGTSSGGTSNLNYVAGQTKARLAIVPLDSTGRMRLSAGGPAGQIDVIVDVQGYFMEATSANTGRTFAVDGGGGRLLDTRADAPVVAGGLVCINVYATRTETANGLPREGLTGVWLSLTVTGVSGAGWVTVAPGSQLTAVSNLNFVAEETRTNSLFVVMPSTTDGTVCTWVAASSAHVVIDVLAMTTA
jgi:hypothetical protein